MLNKIKNDPILGHKIGVVFGAVVGFLLALIVGGKADEVVYIQEEVNADESTTEN